MATPEEVRARVEHYLREANVVYSVDRECVSARFGSARIFLFVKDWGDGDVKVEFQAMLVQDVPPSPELFEHVARSGFAIGSLTCVDGENGLIDVLLIHNQLGQTMDPEEFHLAMALLVQTADEIDDELQAMFGGRKFHED